MKKIKLLVVIFLLTLTVMGCTNKDTNKGEEKNKIEGIAIPKEMDFNACINENGMLGGFNVPVISEKKLELDDLEIKLDANSKYECFLTEVKKDKMPYYVFQSYKGTDWIKMNKLASDEEKEIEFTEYQDKYIEEYTENDKAYNFYYYKLFINFDINNLEDEEISDVIVSYNGKEYKCLLSGLTISTKSEQPKEINDRKEFYVTSVGMCDNYAIPNKEGKIKITDLEYEVEEDAVIKNISILGNDSISIDKATFSNESTNMDIKFAEGMKLSKGDKGEIKLELKDEIFKSKLFYYNNMFLDIEIEANNKIKHEVVFIQVNTKLDPYEVYANVVDGIDILPYYTEYYFYYSE